MDITDFLSGKRILAEVESPINGKLMVIRDLAWGTYIRGGGLTQSGGILEKIWRSTLAQVASGRKHVGRVLILGLGGGSVAKLVRKNWPEAKITGVDVDLVIVDLGKKYLKLEEYDIDVVIDDAFKFLKAKSSKLKAGKGYDLICIDLYIGEEYPKEFESEKFMKAIKTILSENGVVIFNRTYHNDKRPKVVKFGRKLEKVFSNVEWVYPEANVMFVCSN